jgi:hypothetical protein
MDHKERAPRRCSLFVISADAGCSLFVIHADAGGSLFVILAAESPLQNKHVNHKHLSRGLQAESHVGSPSLIYASSLCHHPSLPPAFAITHLCLQPLPSPIYTSSLRHHQSMSTTSARHHPSMPLAFTNTHLCLQPLPSPIFASSLCHHPSMPPGCHHECSPSLSRTAALPCPAG